MKRRERPLPNLDKIPIPVGDEGPVFEEPWEAQAFALAVQLNERGLFEWSEWAEQFGKTIEKNRTTNPERTYFENLLEALEIILTKKADISVSDLVSEQQAWRLAASNTPHGEPIELMRSVNQSRANLNENGR